MAAPIVVTSPHLKVTGVWGHGLCGCFDDLKICLIAYLVPCVTFGQTAEGMGHDCCLYGCIYLFWPCNWFLETRQRGQIRQMRGIQGSKMGDCCLICWLPFCTLVQEAQEVQDMRNEGMTVTMITQTVTTGPPQSGAYQVAAPGGGYTGPAGYVQYVPPGTGAANEQKMARE